MHDYADRHLLSAGLQSDRSEVASKERAIPNHLPLLAPISLGRILGRCAFPNWLEGTTCPAYV